MNKPVTSWKNSLSALGFKVDWDKYWKKRRTRTNQRIGGLEFGKLEPRQMLAQLAINDDLFFTRDQEFSGEVAHFVDHMGDINEYSAEIHWADGDVTQGNFEPDGNGGHAVIGTHEHVVFGDGYDFTVIVNHPSLPATTASSTERIWSSIPVPYYNVPTGLQLLARIELPASGIQTDKYLKFGNPVNNGNGIFTQEYQRTSTGESLFYEYEAGNDAYNERLYNDADGIEMFDFKTTIEQGGESDHVVLNYDYSIRASLYGDTFLVRRLVLEGGHTLDEFHATVDFQDNGYNTEAEIYVQGSFGRSGIDPSHSREIAVYVPYDEYLFTTPGIHEVQIDFTGPIPFQDNGGSEIYGTSHSGHVQFYDTPEVNFSGPISGMEMDDFDVQLYILEPLQFDLTVTVVASEPLSGSGLVAAEEFTDYWFGDDSMGPSKEFTIPAGKTHVSIPIYLQPDPANEETETFFLDVEPDSTIKLGASRLTGTILDQYTTIEFAQVTGQAMEGEQLVVGFQLRNWNNQPVEFVLTPRQPVKNGAEFIADYFATPLVVRIDNQNTTPVVTFDLRDDSITELTELFEIEITDVLTDNATFGDDRTFAGAIIDREPEVYFVSKALTVNEVNLPEASFELVAGLTKASDQPVSVTIDAEDVPAYDAEIGVDYHLGQPANNSSLTIEFLPGETRKRIPVFVPIDDFFDEGVEQFRLVLSNPINSSVIEVPFEGTILGFDQGLDLTKISMSAIVVSGNEGDTLTLNFESTIIGLAGIDAQVTIAEPSGTATWNSDFSFSGLNLVDRTFTVPAGGTYPLSINLLTDDIRELPETILIELESITEGPTFTGPNFIEFTIVPDVWNNAPWFTSRPVTDANVGTEYVYESTATDDEGDSLVFQSNEVIWPAGYIPDPAHDISFEYLNGNVPDQRGRFTWTPAVEMSGQSVTIEEVVWDQINDPVPRTFEIYVHPQVDNHAPVIVSEPDENYTLPIDVGVDAGFDSGDLSIVANLWGSGENLGEFGVTGTHFVIDGVTTYIGSVSKGVAVTDGETGTGYIMYSEQNVHTRFGGLNLGNATRLIGVRVNSSGEWQYNDNNENVNLAWKSFNPVSSDRLLASVDFLEDEVTSLEGKRFSVFEAVENVTPQLLEVTLADGQEIQVDVSITPTLVGAKADIVFVVDGSLSMKHAIDWLKDSNDGEVVLQQIDEQLDDLGVSERSYGLVLFGLVESPEPISIALGNVTNQQSPFDVPPAIDPEDLWGDVSQLIHVMQQVHADGDVEPGQAALTHLFSDQQHDFHPDAASNIVLITDEPSDSFAQDQQEIIRDQVLRDRDISWDDVAVTSLVMSRLAGNDSTVSSTPGNHSWFLPSDNIWNVSDNTYDITPTTPGSDPFLSVIDIPEYESESTEFDIFGNVVNPDSTALFYNWSANVDFVINDLGPDFGQNARIIFGPNAVSTSGDLPADYWYFEVDAITDSWTIGSDGSSVYPMEFHDGYTPPNVVAGQSLSIELRLIAQPNGSQHLPRFDLFINGEAAATVAVPEYPLFGQTVNSINILGVGSDNSGVSFEQFTIHTFDEYNDTAIHALSATVPTPKDFSEFPNAARLAFQNDFGIDGSSFDPEILGIDVGGAAYKLDSLGGYIKLANPDVTTSFSHQGIHYVDLTESVNGSIWSLAFLREAEADDMQDGNGIDDFTPILSSFKNAFTDSFVQTILGQNITLVADSPLVTNIEPIFNPDLPDARSFQVTLTGDGRADNFDMRFIQDNGLETELGRIPTFVSVGYGHDFVVSDYENDTPFEIYFDPAYVDETGEVITHGATLVDSGRTGLISDRLIWEPPLVTEPTDFTFKVLVRDSAGSVSQEVWTVSVQPWSATNSLPVIDISLLEHTDGDDGDGFVGEPLLPPAQAQRGYQYQVIATDPDLEDSDNLGENENDGWELRYYLVPSVKDDGTEISVPDWARIDRQTGLITGRPGTVDADSNTHITVMVTDGQFYGESPNIQIGEVFQTFKINILAATAANSAPLVTPIPDLIIKSNEVFTYQVVATDNNSDVLTYSLLAAPEGMSIHPTNGIISWQPLSNQTGEYLPATVVVSDGRASVMESFQIVATPKNRDPVFTFELPDGVTYLDYREQLTATDVDGNLVKFDLIRGPDGMTIDIDTNDEKGQDFNPDEYYLDWNAGSIEAGTHLVGIRANDGVAGIVDRYFYVTFSDDARPQLISADQPVWRVSTTGIDVGDLGRGVAVTENAAGSGYLLYSQLDVQLRFGNAFPNNASHLIAVQYDGNNWQYNNNYTWGNFTPATSDRLIAEIDFTDDTITSMQHWSGAGGDQEINGINAGFSNGDLTFAANYWNGGTNEGEFGVFGTYFDVGTVNAPVQTMSFEVISPDSSESTTFQLDGTSLEHGMQITNVVETTGGIDGHVYTFDISWLPLYEGIFDPVVFATNAAGTTEFDFEFEVFPYVDASSNRAPVFPDGLLGPFSVDSEVYYPLNITDPDGHDVTITVIGGVEPGQEHTILNGDALYFVSDQSGLFHLTLLATDELGKTAEKSYAVAISDNAQPVLGVFDVHGHAEYIEFPTADDEGYSLEFFAGDPNPGDQISITLNQEAIDAGVDINLDANTVDPLDEDYEPWKRALVWSADEISNWVGDSPDVLPLDLPVVVTVTDSHNNSTQYAFNLPVFDPEATVDVGIHEFMIPVGRIWQMPFDLENPGGHELEFELSRVDEFGAPISEPIPEGLTLSSNGLLDWLPAPEELLGENGQILGAKEFYFNVAVSSYDQDGDPADGFFDCDGTMTSSSECDFPLKITIIDPDAYEDPFVPEIDELGTPPPNAATINQMIVYQPQLITEASNGEEVVWYLIEGPEGMLIDASTGQLNWTPSSDVLGERFDVRLRASSQNAGSLLEFTLDVNAINNAPTINSSLPTVWTTTIPDQLQIQVAGRDPEGHQLGYELINAEGSGISIDADGLLSGTPLEGTYEMTLRVFEVHHPESMSERPFDLVVTPDPVNLEPLFTNSPHGMFASVHTGEGPQQEFKFQFDIADLDQPKTSSHTFGLTGNGATIDEMTGEFTWTPTINDVGIHSFQVSVTDSVSQPNTDPNTRFLNFDIEVMVNELPQLPADVMIEPEIGTTFVYQIEGTDDGRDLRYRLEQNGTDTIPNELTINRRTGELRWNVPLDQSEIGFDVDVVVEDEYGATARQTLTVNPNFVDTTAPTISYHMTDQYGNTIKPGDRINSNGSRDVRMWIEVRDNRGVELPKGAGQNGGWSLTAYNTAGEGDREPMEIDTVHKNGYWMLDFTAGEEFNQGLLEISITAGDAALNITEQFYRYFVEDDVSAEQGRILNVDEHTGPITDRFEVVGNARYLEEGGGVYDLRLTSMDDPTDFVYLARNEPAYRTRSVLGVIDGTQIPSGQYRLYLEVRSNDNQAVQHVDERIVEIKNEVRLGNLDLAFTDMQAAIGGVAIPLIRTYSSGLVSEVDADGNGSFKSDFSAGWNLNFLQSNISVSHPDGVTTQINQPFADETRVLVSLPDGSVERFTFDPVKHSFYDWYIPVLQSDPGSNSQLYVRGVDPELRFVLDEQRGDGTYYAPGLNLAAIPANFGDAFILETENGLKYIFDINNGELTAIEDANDARIEINKTYSNDGVNDVETITIQTVGTGSNNTSEATVPLVITSDNAGPDGEYRIVSITGPAFDEDGENPSTNIVEFRYGDFNPLTGMVDPVGPESVENLAQIVRVSGETESYDYDTTDFDFEPNKHKRFLSHVYDNANIETLHVQYIEDAAGPNDTGPDGIVDFNDYQHGDYNRVREITSNNGLPTEFGFSLDLGDGRKVRSTNTTGTRIEEVINGRGDVLRIIRVIDDAADASKKRYLVTVSEFYLRGLPSRQSKPFYVDENIFGANSRFNMEPPAPADGSSPWASITTYDVEDRLLTSTDATGAVTTNVYDDENGIHKTIDPFGVTSWRVIDTDNGQLVETYTTDGISDERYNHLRFEYNDFGQQIKQWQIVSGQDDLLLSETTFNDDGFSVATKGVQGPTNYVGYDNIGRQTHSWRLISEPGDDAVTLVDVTDYDFDGRVTGNSQYELDGEFAAGDLAALKSALSSGDKLSQSGSYENERGETTVSYRMVTELDGETLVEKWFATLTVYQTDTGRVVYQTDEFEANAVVATDPSLMSLPAILFARHTMYDSLGRADKTERIKGLVVTLTNSTSDEWRSSVQSGTNEGTRQSHSITEFDDAGRVKSTTSFAIDSDEAKYGLKTTNFYNLKGQVTQTVSEAWNADANDDVTDGSDKVFFVTRTVFDDLDRVAYQTDSFLAAQEPIDCPDVFLCVFTPHENETVFATKTEYDQAGRGYKTTRLKDVTISITGSDASIPVPNDTSFVPSGEMELHSSETYYDRGRVERSISADGQETFSEYDSLGRQIASVGALVMINGEQVRHRTETIYNERGQVQTQRSNILHNYNGEGDHNTDHVQETRYNYDDAGNVIRTIFADSTYAVVRYDSQGRTVAESEQIAADVTAEIEWSDDDNSFFYAVENEDNVLIPTRTSEYNTQGQLVAVELPSVPDPDNPGSNARPRYEYQYDARGNQTHIIDPNGNTTLYQFDELGREESRTLPYEFGDDGTPDTADDRAIGSFTEYFQYDNRGRQKLYISFEGVHTVSVYDNKTGRMTETLYFEDGISYAAWVSDNNVTPDENRVYTFDDKGRRSEVEHFAAGVSNRTETTTYTIEGQVESVVNNEGTIHYSYDDLGRMTRTSFSGNSFQPVDSDDFENATTYTYDELGRLKTVTAIERNGEQGTADETTYTYDPLGNLDTTIYSSGLIHDYEYDALNRLETLTHYVDDIIANGEMDEGEQRAIFEYEIDERADGKRTGVTERFWLEEGGALDSPIEQNIFDWDYDAAGRLVYESLDSLHDDSLEYVDTFAYDLTGNREETHRNWLQSANDYTTTYQYDVNDRLTTETKNNTYSPDETTTYGYTQTQQTSKVTTRDIGGDDVTVSTQTFTYNLQGRMESVTKEGFDNKGVRTEHTQTRYEYDSGSNRVATDVVTDVNDDGVFDAEHSSDTVTRTEYLTDTQNHTGYSQVLQETEYVDGEATKKTVYTIGQDQISQTVYEAVDDGDPETVVWNELATHYFGTDGHGSVRVLYDLAAAVIANDHVGNNIPAQIYHYDAYGNLHNFANDQPLTNYLYSGEAFDFNIGQQYLRARFYDPVTGRFNRLDPFYGNQTDPQSFHKYAYVHGDPIFGIDPTGEFVIASAAALSAAAAALASGIVIIGILESGGRIGTALRDLGLQFMIDDNFELGFYAYNTGNRILQHAFGVIEQLEIGVGVAGIGALATYGAMRLASRAPTMASNLLKLRKTLFSRGGCFVGDTLVLIDAELQPEGMLFAGRLIPNAYSIAVVSLATGICIIIYDVKRKNNSPVLVRRKKCCKPDSSNHCSTPSKTASNYQTLRYEPIGMNQ